MIRIDADLICHRTLNMRAGTETVTGLVVEVSGAVQPHCAYLSPVDAPIMKVLVHDSFGVWIALRRLNQGRFVWPGSWQNARLELSAGQLRRWCWSCLGAGRIKRGDRPVIAACNYVIGRTAYRRTEAELAQSASIRPP